VPSSIPRRPGAEASDHDLKFVRTPEKLKPPSMLHEHCSPEGRAPRRAGVRLIDLERRARFDRSGCGAAQGA
jgi:hypothetical protein